MSRSINEDPDREIVASEIAPRGPYAVHWDHRGDLCCMCFEYKKHGGCRHIRLIEEVAKTRPDLQTEIENRRKK